MNFRSKVVVHVMLFFWGPRQYLVFCLVICSETKMWSVKTRA